MILAIDPGTKTGWAVGNRSFTLSGVWNLKPGRFEGGGMRFVKLRQQLDKIHGAYPITAIFFEEVRAHKGVDAAHVYGGVVAVLTEFCEEKKIPYEGVPVGTIKKSATGKGNAPKEAMIAAAEAWGFDPADDNEADALALKRLKVMELEG